MRTFIEAGYLEPFPDGEFRPDDFLPGPWWTGTGSDGRQYGIPFKSDVGLLFYRKDLMPGRRGTGTSCGTGPSRTCCRSPGKVRRAWSPSSPTTRA